MDILCCGDRDWDDVMLIKLWLASVAIMDGVKPREIRVVHGACRGADLASGKAAARLHMDVHSYPADWDRFGKAAGPIRNKKMLDENNIEYVLAFHSDIRRSKGTRDMIEQANARGIPVILIPEPRRKDK